MNGTAPNRAASRGMCEAVANMPRPQLAATMPMVSLSTPWRSKASGTIGIETVARQKLGVAATLDDAAAVEHDDLVGVDDGRQPVGDHHGGAAAAHLFQRALDLLLGARVERAGRLIEQQDLRVLEDRAGDRHPLLLAAR